MKKSILFIAEISSLAVLLAVSSFAWFQITTNINNPDNLVINTKDEAEFIFAKNEFIDEALAPAKLKKGVLVKDESNNWTFDGTNKVPTGTDLLPKTTTGDSGTEYFVNSEGRMVSKTVNGIDYSEYFDYPSTVVYSQYRFIAFSKEITFNFDVYYPKISTQIDYDKTLTKADLDRDFIKFTQEGALTFNFFVIPYHDDYTLTPDELRIASTSIGTANAGKKTIENVLVNHNTNAVQTNGMKLCGMDSGVISAKQESDIVRINATKPTDATTNPYSYTFSLKNLPISDYSGYNLIVETYYSVADMFVDSNIPLSGEFVLNFKVN